ncbi:MAG: sulfatase [Kofleriaceae bacterium]
MAGVVEGVGAGGASGLAVAAGFFALIAIPVLLAGGLIARGIARAWAWKPFPGPGLVDDDGTAPRLVGWIAAGALGCLVLGLIVYKATWTLAETTSFRPLGVSFAEPLIAVAGALLVLGLSRPAARLFAELARRGDARWRSRGRTTLLAPRTIVITAATTVVLLTYLTWRILVKPRLGPIDTGLLTTPTLAVVVAIAVHLAWSRIPRRRIAGALAGVLGIAAIAVAVLARITQPSLTLEIWGDRPLAGLAIDTLFDLEDIRADVSLAEFKPVDRPGAVHPDIILVTIDTVRADHTPPYGGSAEMPVLAELGERGAVFSWAFAPSNVTRRSIPSIVVGLAPNRVRGRVVGWALRVDPRHVLLAERLAAGGYDTAGFMCCYGFWSPEVRTGLQRGLQHLVIEPTGPKLAKLASAWLEAREHRTGNKPLFLWMHVLEPHNWTLPTGVPRNDADRQKFYDKSLTASDGMLGELLRPLRERGPGAAPIVIVTADHGEALGEHGHDYHSTDLYNSQMRVPLVIAGPGVPHQRLAETVSLVDLVPTIVELAGFQPPTNLDGRSLVDIATGKRVSTEGTGTAFAAMIKDRSNPGGVTALVKGGWKIIDTEGGNVELYDIYKDPDEHVNQVDARPEILHELRALLEARKAAGGVSPFD